MDDGVMTESERAARIEGDACSYSGYGAQVEWASLGEMATRYWSDHARTGDASYGPAQEFVAEFTEVGDPVAVEVIQSLVDAAPTDVELDFVGAGPLEDLLSHNGHGLTFVDQVERRARRDPRFRAAVAGLWLSKDVPESVRSRLAALGVKAI
jgi:hypothetical protein